MNPSAPKNVPASIHQRLLNKARATHRPFDELLRYFAIERFLYRLSQSSYRDRLVLKGALIFTAWGQPLGRPTRDVDLLAYTGNAVEEVVSIFRAICGQAVADDGLRFDPATVAGSRISEQADYQGVRVRFLGYLGTARARMQVDLGFGDVVTPRPALIEYPSLLALPRPTLQGYPRETVVAEKAHALITLGRLNSRMKDFYDLWLLARQFDFEGPLLTEAVRRTLAHRNVPLSSELPEGLSAEFGREKQAQWQAFLTTSEALAAPQSLQSVLEVVRGFLMPVLQAASPSSQQLGRWQAPGPWQPVKTSSD